jgi:hypothetical protein
MAAGRDDRRQAVHRELKKSQQRQEKKQHDENETHVENRELCRREHTRWHFDETVLDQLNEMNENA